MLGLMRKALPEDLQHRRRIARQGPSLLSESRVSVIDDEGTGLFLRLQGPRGEGQEVPQLQSWETNLRTDVGVN